MMHMAGPYCADCGGWHPQTTGGCPFDKPLVVDFTKHPIASIDMRPVTEEIARLRTERDAALAQLAAERERTKQTDAALFALWERAEKCPHCCNSAEVERASVVLDANDLPAPTAAHPEREVES